MIVNLYDNLVDYIDEFCYVLFLVRYWSKFNLFEKPLD